MPEKIDLKYAIGLKPEKAIEYFKSKGYSFSWNWQDVWQEAHAKAFTVAKVIRMDILQDIRNEVQRALDEGTTLQEFKKNLTPVLQNKGWWGRKLVGDGKGGAEEVQLGSPRRLETIYKTNLQSAYMAGRYKEMTEDVDNRPYWQYVAVMDSRTRPGHAALNGLVFKADDPFWDTHYPPLGFRCRCRVRPLSDKNRADRGLKVSSSEGKLSNEEVIVSKKTGEAAEVTAYAAADPMTGKKLSVAPDPGFNYNPGKAAWQPNLDKYDYPVAKKYIEGAITGPDFTRFFAGKAGGVFPVAALNEEYRQTIGAKSQTVLLSDETLAKNKGEIRGAPGHPELTIEEYQKLPLVISQAEVIIKDSDVTLVFIKMDGRYYHAAIKTTQSGETLFLTSFRRVDDVKREIDRLRKKSGAKVLKDALK